MDIAKLSKIDLHCHLDGSLSADFVRTHAKKTLPADDAALYSMLRAPERCRDLAEYLTRFDLPLSCLQSASDISDAVYDVLKTQSADGVLYCELRYAPQLHTAEGLSLRDVIEASIDGLQRAVHALPIKANLILCAMRHHSEEENLAMLRCGREYLHEGVCAIDLAGDEAHFDNELFAPLFAEARRLDMPFTIHSGECGRAENVALAIEYGAARVGHGIAIFDRPDIISLVKEHRTGLELCPTSNFQTGAVKHEADYPLSSFLSKGLLATVNTDNLTVSNTSVTKELALCMDSLGLHEDDLSVLFQNSVMIAFADDNIKHDLLSKR